MKSGAAQLKFVKERVGDIFTGEFLIFFENETVVLAFSFGIEAFDSFIVANVLEIIKVIGFFEEHLSSFIFFSVGNIELVTKIERIIMRSVIVVIALVIVHLDDVEWLM